MSVRAPPLAQQGGINQQPLSMGGGKVVIQPGLTPGIGGGPAQGGFSTQVQGGLPQGAPVRQVPGPGGLVNPPNPFPGGPIIAPPQPQAEGFAPQPQFGLAGAEQAFQQGAFGGASALQTGQQNALQTLLAGFGQGQQQLAQGAQALGGNFGAAAGQVDPLTGQPLFQQAAQGVGQFTGAGLQAQDLQSALSGAQGQEAFNQALIQSPQQAFINQLGEEAVINQAAATGGVGGGEVLRDLQQLGQARASQQVQQQIQNLAQLSGQGLQAAGQAGQFLSQAGGTQAQLAGQQAQLNTQANLASAANRLGAAQGQAQLFGQGAGLTTQLAGQGAGIQVGTGQGIAQLLANAGGQIGGARTQAGQDISGATGTTAANLAQLIAAQGSGLSDIIGAGGANLGQLLTGAGGAASAGQSQLAQLLANVSQGQATNLGNLATQAGNIGLLGGQTGSNLALAQGANQQDLLRNLTNVFGFGGGP